MRKSILLVGFVLALVSCSVSYKFNGASIDYTKVKTISISDFPNRSVLVYPPLSQTFTEKLRDKFIRQTKLKMVSREGDLQIEGDIVGYELTPMAQQTDGYAAETKLTVTINVRFVNTTNPEEDFEKRYSAYKSFETTNMLEDVQDELLEEIIEEITDNIFNDTVSKW